MQKFPIYTFLKAVILGAMLLLNSCDNCKNSHKPSTKEQTLKGNPTPPNSEPKPKPELDPGTEIPVKNKGIPNIGNSCYMNSVIQILASFYRGVFAENKEDKLAGAANNIINAITGQEEVSSSEIKTRANLFFETLEKPNDQGGIGWINKRIKQEDADELLTQIFQKFELPKARTINKYIHPTTKAVQLGQGSDLWTMWKMEIPEDKSKIKTMQDLFNNSLLPEEGVEKRWFGSDRPTPDDPTIKVTKAPVLKDLDKLYGKMLVISLKRFKHEERENSLKITKEIDNPLKLVIKKEQTTDSTQDLHYELTGFIEHRGNTGGGHYVAYTKVGEQWVYYSDDDPVSEVPVAVAEAAAKKAYIFFYKQT